MPNHIIHFSDTLMACQPAIAACCPLPLAFGVGGFFLVMFVLGFIWNRRLAAEAAERKRVEAALRKSEAMLNEAQALARIGGWEWDLQAQRLTWSDEVYRIFGEDPARFAPSAEAFEARIHPDDLADFLSQRERMLTERDAACIDHRIVLPSGEVRHVQERAQLIRNAEGQALRAIGTVQDITDRKGAEAALKRSIRVKDALLREVHHRVKNNLAMISSLLRMKAAGVADAAVARQFDEMRERIMAIARVHEDLYASEDPSRIDFKKYLENLTRDLSSLGNDPDIAMRAEFDAFFLDIQRAIPCGLLYIELLTNALKHAFPRRRDGSDDSDGPTAEPTRWPIDEPSPMVRSALVIAGDELRLSVADNGVGLPADFDWRQTRSMGLRLVRILTEQLDGRLSVVSEPGRGARFEMTISTKQPPP